jgi:hypothetical protein
MAFLSDIPKKGFTVMRWRMICCALLMVYGALFYQQERMARATEPRLPYPLPATVQKAVLGFLHQISGEILFIRTSVFYGNPSSNPTEPANASSLESNFNVMADLHPFFIDTYFLCQSALAYQGESHTRAANKVLAKGMVAMPDLWLLPFFKGFNHFFYLKENRQAADDLFLASKLPGAATWLGRLASKLAAEEGDIINGIIWLKVMLKAEKDEEMRKRYQQEIADFEKAYAVQKAIAEFSKKKGRVPDSLEDLIPAFLSELPEFNNAIYYLEWKPPLLKLKRSIPAK